MASDAEAAASPSEGGSDHDADMEFARKLQEEEDRIHYEHMLQMAGIGTNSSSCLLLLSNRLPSIVKATAMHSFRLSICLHGVNK